MSGGRMIEADPVTTTTAKTIGRDFAASVESLGATPLEVYAAAIIILAKAAVHCGAASRVHPVDVVAQIAEAAMHTLNDPRNGVVRK
jgi:hypothetical protein